MTDGTETAKNHAGTMRELRRRRGGRSSNKDHDDDRIPEGCSTESSKTQACVPVFHLLVPQSLVHVWGWG